MFESFSFHSCLSFDFNERVPLLLVILLLLLGMVLFMAIMLPLGIVIRFRAGATRRRAWGWMVTLNFYATALSSTLLLVSAAVGNRWIPDAFRYTLLGFASGFLLGGFGLLLSRWETTPAGVHYTPNRWLILLITVVVASRIIYGFWRAWNAWSTTPGDESWLAASGAAGSMAAGAAVLGYYLIYWAGLSRKVRINDTR
ncbi:MAG TPA: DUF1453 domain-containing protein [Thermoanaerobaculia bacterium]